MSRERASRAARWKGGLERPTGSRTAAEAFALRAADDGLLAIADDLMAWAITHESIVMRQVGIADRVQAPPPTMAYKTAKRSGESRYSKFVNGGKWKEFTRPPLPEC